MATVSEPEEQTEEAREWTRFKFLRQAVRRMIQIWVDKPRSLHHVFEKSHEWERGGTKEPVRPLSRTRSSKPLNQPSVVPPYQQLPQPAPWEVPSVPDVNPWKRSRSNEQGPYEYRPSTTGDTWPHKIWLDDNTTGWVFQPETLTSGTDIKLTGYTTTATIEITYK